MTSVLILALGGTGGANAEDASDTDKSPSVEAAPPAEVSEEAADEAGSPAEKPDTEAAEANESPSVDAAPLAEASAEAADETSPPAEKSDTEASEAEEE